MYELTRIENESIYLVSNRQQDFLYLYHWTNYGAMRSILGLNGTSPMEVKGNDARGQINFFPSFNNLTYDNLISNRRAKRPLGVSIITSGKQYLLAFKFEIPTNLRSLVNYTTDAFASVGTTLNLTLNSHNLNVPRVIHFFDANKNESHPNTIQLSDIDDCWHTSFELGSISDLGLNLTFEGIKTTVYNEGDELVFEKFQEHEGCTYFNKTKKAHNTLVNSINRKLGQRIKVTQKI